MMKRGLVLLLIGAFGVVFVPGCAPVHEPQVGPDPVITFAGITNQVLDMKEPSTARVVELAGEPDVKVGVGEFYEMLKKSSPKSKKYADSTMDYIYEGYLGKTGVKIWQVKTEPGSWQRSEEFKSLSFWVYKWHNPDIVEYTSAHVTDRYVVSYYFLVEGSRVINGDRFERSQ